MPKRARFMRVLTLRSPQAAEFYSFLKSMATYRRGADEGLDARPFDR